LAKFRLIGETIFAVQSVIPQIVALHFDQRDYAAARLYVNFLQPSFKLKDKRREGAKVIKRYHAPSTPHQRAPAHPKVTAAVKKRLRDQYRSLDPVGLLAEIRATQEELGNRGRSSCRTGARPATRLDEYRAGDRSNVREDARQDGDNRVPRTGAPVGPIRPGFACRPSSTRILLRSRAGSPSSHS
jgi:hypothetical protein